MRSVGEHAREEREPTTRDHLCSGVKSSSSSIGLILCSPQVVLKVAPAPIQVVSEDNCY